jgi:hypothetical protein
MFAMLMATKSLESESEVSQVWENDGVGAAGRI